MIGFTVKKGYRFPLKGAKQVALLCSSLKIENLNEKDWVLQW